jgi:hypothetical protein
LAQDCWERRHELAFALELHRAECEFLTGAVMEAEQRLVALSGRATTTVERASVTCLQVDLCTTLDQGSRAIAVGLDYVRHLGIEWSAHPTKDEVRREYKRIWSQLGPRAIESLIDLPSMSNAASLATLDVLTEVDPTGWNSTHPFLSKTMTELRPEVTVEVRVWKGASTLTMANALRELGVDGVVIAVDTWLGSWGQWIKPELHAELCFLQGYPNLYMKFLANVVASGLGDFVVPCPLDSGNAAQLMAMRQVVPTVVHIDGAHDVDAVQQDLRRWWPLLANGGTMICDDYDETNAVWPEVKRAVDRFLAATPHANFECSPYKCRLQKPV